MDQATKDVLEMIAKGHVLEKVNLMTRVAQLEAACRDGANAISYLRVAIDKLPGELPQELQNAFVGSGPTQALLERMGGLEHKL